MDLSKEADATNRVSTENLTSLTSCWWPVIRAVNNGIYISDYSSMKQECYCGGGGGDGGSGGGGGGVGGGAAAAMAVTMMIMTILIFRM
jgi:hypothetical protein